MAKRVSKDLAGGAGGAPVTPLKLPRGVRAVWLYGGSFDPPTWFHVGACMAPNWMGRGDAVVVYVPAARNPLKERGPVASDEDRVAMLEAGLREYTGRGTGSTVQWRVWTDEIDRAAFDRARGVEGASYTIDTVRRLRRAVGDAVEVRLLIGADQAVQFKRWRAWRKLLKDAEPLVVLRAPFETPAKLIDALAAGGASEREQVAWARRIVPRVPVEVSSTAVRELLKGAGVYNRWPAALKVDVQESVARYIVENGLYGVRGRVRIEREA